MLYVEIGLSEIAGVFAKSTEFRAFKETRPRKVGIGGNVGGKRAVPVNERFQPPHISMTPYTATPITQPIAIEMSQRRSNCSCYTSISTSPIQAPQNGL
jgi:hypothetical protein